MAKNDAAATQGSIGSGSMLPQSAPQGMQQGYGDSSGFNSFASQGFNKQMNPMQQMAYNAAGPASQLGGSQGIGMQQVAGNTMGAAQQAYPNNNSLGNESAMRMLPSAQQPSAGYGPMQQNMMPGLGPGNDVWQQLMQAFNNQSPTNNQQGYNQQRYIPKMNFPGNWG